MCHNVLLNFSKGMILGEIFIITLLCNILAAAPYINNSNVSWNCLSSKINVFVRIHRPNVSRISALRPVPNTARRKPPLLQPECEFIKDIDGWSNFTIDLHHFAKRCGVNFDESRQNLWIDFVEHSHPLLDFDNDLKFHVNCPTSQLENFISNFNESKSLEHKLPKFSLELFETSNDSSIENYSVQNNFVIYGKSYSLAAKLNNFDQGFQIQSCTVKSLADDRSNESQAVELIDSRGCSTDLKLNGNFIYTSSPDSIEHTALLSIPSMFQFYDSKFLIFECVAELFVQPIDCLDTRNINRHKRNAETINSKNSTKNVFLNRPTVNSVNDSSNEFLWGSGTEADEDVNADDTVLNSQIFSSSNLLFPITSEPANETIRISNNFLQGISSTNKVLQNNSTTTSSTRNATESEHNNENKNDSSSVEFSTDTKILSEQLDTLDFRQSKRSKIDLATTVPIQKLRPSILTARIIVCVINAVANNPIPNSAFIKPFSTSTVSSVNEFSTTSNLGTTTLPKNSTVVKSLSTGQLNVTPQELENLYKVFLGLAVLFVLSCFCNALICCCFSRNSTKKSQIKRRTALSNSSQQFFHNSTGTLQTGTLQKKMKENNSSGNNHSSYWIPEAGFSITQKLPNGVYPTSDANERTGNSELGLTENVMTNLAHRRISVNSYASVKHRSGGNRIHDPLSYGGTDSGIENAVYRPSPTTLSTASTKNGFWRQTFNDLDSEDSRRHKNITSKTFSGGSGFGDEVTMNTSVITSTRSTNSSGGESVTSSSMLVDDTASTMPSSPQPDSFENAFGEDLPPPPPQHNQPSVYNTNPNQILPLQLSTLKRNVEATFPTPVSNLKPNCHMNGLNGNTPHRVAPLPPLSTFSSFQQSNKPTNEMIYGSKNDAAYCNPLMIAEHNQDSMIYDHGMLENESKQNVQHVYSIL